jgi:hypothetical protein
MSGDSRSWVLCTSHTRQSCSYITQPRLLPPCCPVAGIAGALPADERGVAHGPITEKTLRALAFAAGRPATDPSAQEPAGQGTSTGGPLTLPFQGGNVSVFYDSPNRAIISFHGADGIGYSAAEEQPTAPVAFMAEVRARGHSATCVCQSTRLSGFAHIHAHRYPSGMDGWVGGWWRMGGASQHTILHRNVQQRYFHASTPSAAGTHC